MSGRTIILLVIGIIVTFGIVSLRNRFSQEAVSTEPVIAESSRIVIAKRDLAPGTFVQGPQDLDWGASPTPAPSNQADGNAPTNASPDDNPSNENYLREGAVRLTDFNGAVVRRQLRAGEPIPQSALMKSGEGGFMSAVLNPGMRAVTIAVNATSGNAGFISPGDRVDLIVTHRIRPHSNDGSADEAVVSETFVRDVRTVAVDQMLDNPENKAILAKTVTVEVTPRQAELISVAAEMGKISITLRSLTNPEKVAAKPGSEINPVNPIVDLYGAESASEGGVTRDSDLSQLLERRSLNIPRVQVIHGDKVENLDFQGSK